jgi:hypothetical protein
MFVGWRMGDDLKVMSELPDGTISVNLLTGEANHSLAGSLSLHIAKEIQAWLQQQSKKENIDISQLETATLEVDVDTGKVATNKKKVIMFTFECRSLIKTSDATYQTTVRDTHQWHTRKST